MNYLHTTLVTSGGMEGVINATFKIVTKTATKYTSIEDITNDVNNFIGYECVSPLVGEDLLGFDDWYGAAVDSAIYNGGASITSEKISLGNVLVIEKDGTQNTVIPVADYLHMDEVTTAIPRISVDLATAFPDKWAALTPGEHTIQIRAKNPGNYLDSDLSTAKTFYKTVPITATATNCTAAASNPTEFPDVGGGDTILTFNKKTGYTLPETIVITGVAGQNIGYSWTVASDGQSAQLKILKALGNIEVTVTGVVETYNITVETAHATKESGPSTIAYGASATLTFTFPTGYEAPASVTVTGATPSWEAGTGTLTLTKAQGPVAITVKGVATTTTIDGGTYKWFDNAALTEWAQEINFTSNGASYSGMRYTGNGTAMTLQYMDADAEWQTVYNYDEDSSTGSWVNTAWQIVDLGTSAQTVTAIFKADFVANTTKLTQLATPQNVSADGTVVSWDEVENATSYEVLADGSEIGTVENQTGYNVSVQNVS